MAAQFENKAKKGATAKEEIETLLLTADVGSHTV
jgi:hypothetical protein